MHWGYGMGGWMMFFWFLLAVAIIALVVWAITRAAAPQGRSAGPEEVLRERYARGEITREQFEQMREDLRR